MEIKAVRIEKPEPVNFILGQSHFIKTVEDIHEVLVGAFRVSNLDWRFVRHLANVWCDGAERMMA